MSKASDYAVKGALIGAVAAGVIALLVSGVAAMFWAALIVGVVGAGIGGAIGSSGSIGGSADDKYLDQQYSTDQVIARQQAHQQQKDRILSNADEDRSSINSRFYTERVSSGRDDWGDRSF